MENMETTPAESVEQQVVAEPAGGEDTVGDTEVEGVEEQEAAEPAPQDASKPAQSEEDNSKFAAARRRAEREYAERLERERQQITASRDEEIAKMGLVNPYTQKPVTTYDDFQAYNAQHEAVMVQEQLAEAGIDPKVFDVIIKNHPLIKKAEDAAKAYEAEKQRTEQARVKARQEENLKKLSELDPEVKSWDDFFNTPYAQEMTEYIQKYALPFEKAFQLANMDRQIQKASKKAAQAALNNSGSKGHLEPTGQRGGGGETIPADVMQQYQKLFPGRKASDYQTLWNKTRSMTKKG